MPEELKTTRIEITRLPDGFLANKFYNPPQAGDPLEINAVCLETIPLPGDYDLETWIEKNRQAGWTVRRYPPVKKMGWPERWRLWRGEPRPIRTQNSVLSLRRKLSQAMLTLDGFDLAYDF